jgi:hypothetical protein
MIARLRACDLSAELYEFLNRQTGQCHLIRHPPDTARTQDVGDGISERWRMISPSTR